VAHARALFSEAQTRIALNDSQKLRRWEGGGGGGSKNNRKHINSTAKAAKHNGVTDEQQRSQGPLWAYF